MCFEGREKTYEALDDKVIEGPLVHHWKALSGRRERVARGRSGTLAWRLRPFVSEKAGQIEESMRQERRWHYPLEALREGVVNALTYGD